MQLYNTLSRKLEQLKPLNPPEVTIYTCGPTVYNYPHIGNWTVYIYWDLLIRTLLLNDYQPKRVINFTDVGHLVSDSDEGEDKLEKAAKRERKTAWEIADFYINDFKVGYQKLNLIQPYAFARATDFIDQQLDIIRQLHQLGLTYQIDDGIYLDTSKIENYGKLTNLQIDDLKAGARVEFNQQKRNLTDFAVWKFSPQANRDMEWETPIDIMNQPAKIMGFPGWHLECSAIILSLLGEQIDIHGGGIDHIPIHHTNEIAQMEPLTNKPVANIWLHANFMKINNSKLSKSLNNSYTLQDIEAKGFSPIDLKMLVLQSHYQSESNFTFDLLQDAKNRLHDWQNIACLRHQIHPSLNQQPTNAFKPLATKQYLLELANNNLDSPQILAEIDKTLSKIQRLIYDQASVDQKSFAELLVFIDDLLGLELIKTTADISDEAKQLIQQRKSARQNKDYAKSDQLREELDQLNIAIDDSTNNSFWHYK